LRLRFGSISIISGEAHVKTPDRAPGARSVLLIEDDAPTRDAMSELLTGEGLRVIASDEGRKALELAGFTRPALVVLDLATPGMTGWEFLERRGEVPALAGVPVLVVTASAAEPPRDTAVLRKPVEPRELLAAVRALLRRSASARA
jgi:two-component system phosphate regulon response regulator PhoB